MMEVLDFYADWCMPCKVLSPVLDKVASEKSIKVVKINIEDDVDDMALNYGVRNIPTVIAFNGESELGRFTGAKSESELNKFFDGLEK